MKLFAISIVSGFLAAFAFAGPSTQPSTQPAAAPVNKFCAVMGEDHKIDQKVTVEYAGKTVGFCCSDCIPDFKKDPEKYMKSLK